MSSADLPFSSNINNNALASVFRHKVASYKFYWFLAIIEEIEKGSKVIPKESIFTSMIANSWYTVNYFRLSFGYADQITNLILDIKNNTSLSDNSKINDIKKTLLNKNTKIIEKLYHLDKNVPHKFLSPWLKGKKSDIENKSQEDYKNVIYRLYKKQIEINDNWFIYLKENSKIIKDFIYWNLAQFVQARNPSTPDVVSKLIKPAKRSALTKQRKEFWSIYLDQRPNAKCIFTHKLIDKYNYDVDHFVPYSFVSHDLIWNLIPIDSGFNRVKNDKIPKMEEYFQSFYEIQKDAINFFGNSMPKK